MTEKQTLQLNELKEKNSQAIKKLSLSEDSCKDLDDKASRIFRIFIYQCDDDSFCRPPVSEIIQEEIKFNILWFLEDEKFRQELQKK